MRSGERPLHAVNSYHLHIQWIKSWKIRMSSIRRGIAVNVVPGQNCFSSAPGLRAGLFSDLSAGDTRLPRPIERSCQDFRPVDLRWQKEVTWITRQWRAGLPLWYSRIRRAAASPTDKPRNRGPIRRMGSPSKARTNRGPIRRVGSESSEASEEETAPSRQSRQKNPSTPIY